MSHVEASASASDQDAISNIRKLGHHLARHSSTDDSSTIHHLFQRLSIFL